MESTDESKHDSEIARSLSPVSVMLYSALGFIAFDVLVSLHDTVPVVVRGDTFCLACLFGLGCAGCLDPGRFFWRSQHWARASTFLAATIACVGTVTILASFGFKSWFIWTLAILSSMPQFLIVLGVCRVLDQLAPHFSDTK